MCIVITVLAAPQSIYIAAGLGNKKISFPFYFHQSSEKAFPYSVESANQMVQ
jgi:hypothetical protein